MSTKVKKSTLIERFSSLRLKPTKSRVPELPSVPSEPVTDILPKPKSGDIPKPRKEGEKLTNWELREFRELIRYRYALDKEIWSCRDVKAWDREFLCELMRQSDAALLRILNYTRSWDSPDFFSSESEYQKFQEVKVRLLERGKRFWEYDPPWKEHDESEPMVLRTPSLSSNDTSRLMRGNASLSTGYMIDPSTRPTTAAGSTDSARTSFSRPDQTHKEQCRVLEGNFGGTSYAPRLPDEPSEEISTARWSIGSAIKDSEDRVLTRDQSTLDSKSFSLVSLNENDASTGGSRPKSRIIDSFVSVKPCKPSLLDPVSYFASLDALELEVASTCQIYGFKEWKANVSPLALVNDSEPLDIYTKEMDQRVQNIERIREAFALLEKKGYCKTQFSALVQDRKRLKKEAIPVANAIHITSSSLEDFIEIGRQARRNLTVGGRGTIILLKHRTQEIFGYIRTLGFGIPPRKFIREGTLGRFVRLFDFVCWMLRLSLVSYAGSHNCPFDETIFKEEMSSFDLAEGCALRRRKLKCLDEYVGGPVWIWEHQDMGEEEYILSVSIEQLVDLWGPVWITPTEDPLVSSVISTTRGIIYPVSENLTEAGEVQCHFSAISDPTEHAATCPVPLTISTRLLIGMESFFVVNEKCDGDVKACEQRNNGLFQPPGTHKDYWLLENVQGGIALGQHIVPNSIFVWKRNRGVPYKNIILDFLLDPTEDHLPWLKQTVGLEISSCTSNAQRISLWEALSIANQNKKPHSHQSTCAHQVGEYECITDCWEYVPKRKSIEKYEAVHEAILRSMKRLQYTGFDKTGKFQAWWPFSDHPKTLHIKKEHDDKSGSSNWIPLLKDSWVVATYAVISNRCLEYESSKSKTDELHLQRTCARITHPSPRLSKFLRPVSTARTDVILFGTELQLQAGNTASRDESSPRRDQDIRVGDRLRVKEIGSVKIANEDEARPRLAEFEKGGWLRHGDRVVSEHFMKEDSDEENLDGHPGVLRLFIA